MTKKEFLEIIQDCPDDMEIKLYNEQVGLMDIDYISIRVDVKTMERFIEVE